MKKASWIIALVVGFAAGFAIDRVIGHKSTPIAAKNRLPARPSGPPPTPNTSAAKVALRPDDPSRGPENAKVTIAVFSDFQCPYCARVEPTLRQVEKAFPGSIRITWKNLPLPFHHNAQSAAEAAEAARQQGKFWEMHDQLFANQSKLGPELFETAAKELGLDLARFKSALADHSGVARIEEDKKQASSLGVNGTPALFINCRLVSGAYPFESIKPILEDEVHKADALMTQGKSGTALYDALCEENTKKYPAPSSPTSAAPALPGGRAAVATRSDDPAKGKTNAPVVVVEFSDFQCPFCSRAEPAVAEVVKAYPDQVRLIWKHLPLPMHPNARPAAIAAEAARLQGGATKFWAMHDKLFEKQRELSPDLYEKIAKEIGLNVTRFKHDLESGALKARVDEDEQLARKLNVNGTPTFIVNGERVVGSGGLRAAVERQLASAKKK